MAIKGHVYMLRECSRSFKKYTFKLSPFLILVKTLCASPVTARPLLLPDTPLPPCFSRLFSCSFPVVWKCAWVFPIFKKQTLNLSWILHPCGLSLLSSQWSFAEEVSAPQASPPYSRLSDRGYPPSCVAKSVVLMCSYLT